MSTTEERLHNQQQTAPEASAESAISRQAPPPPAAVDEDQEGTPDRGPIMRPLAAAALTSLAAGLMTGGIFGVWQARLLAAGAALLGVGWAWLALRQKRAVMVQAFTLPVAAILGLITLIPGSDPSQAPDLIAKAFQDGRLLRPPVPFDAGWRPVLTVLLFMLGFAAAWVATALNRPQLALMLPLPVVGLTAISQPAEADLTAAILAFVPVLGALAVLFGGDARGASELSSAFEVKRAVRGLAFMAVAVVVLVGLSRADFLFPEPLYDPAERPQRPRSVPLSEVEDRVLFEIESDGFTGPWRTGVMDVYDGIDSWRLPPFDDRRYQPLPADGVVDNTRQGTTTVRFTVRDLGATPTFPGTATPTHFELIEAPQPVQVMWDARQDTFRVRQGRVDPGTVYEISLPEYPTAEQLTAAMPALNPEPHTLEITDPPPAVRDLLASAPQNPWERLDFLRSALLRVAIAVGSGEPRDITAAKVQDILAGSNEASPFELVAAEAMLARWAGLPSRIGFGFDFFNEEEGLKTIRPRQGASWLEVQFEGYGWVPLIATPQQAQATLDTDPHARFDMNIQPSDDVAVELYIPIAIEDIRLLYQRIRAELLYWLPWIVLGTAAYLSWPAGMRAARRWRRRRWASAQGPRAQIAVEYAEFRDMAMDLTVGDPYDTPLEYLDKVQDDQEHEELAWLVTRAMYGDLSHEVTDADARAAESLSASLRRRLFRAQPFQSRLLAVLSRASLRLPYTTEVPTVPQLSIPRPKLSLRSRKGSGGRRRVLSLSRRGS